MFKYIRLRGATLIPAVVTMTIVAFITLLPATARAANESEAAARALVVDALATSHFVELYGDVRQYVRNVMAPLAEEVVSGKFVLPPIRDQFTREYQTEVFKLYILADKAAEPIGVAATTYREEIIDDLARIVAKHSSPDEIEAAQAALRLEVTRKTFSSIYRLNRWSLTKTAEETRALMAFGAFAQDMMTLYRERGNKPENATPSPERVAKAIAITNAWWQQAQIDKLALSYLRVAELASNALDDSPMKTEVLTVLDNLKRQYPTMKIVWSSMLSTWLATMLTEEQLEQLQRDPGVALFAEMFVEMEQWLASYTQSDMDAGKTFVVVMMEKGLPKSRNAEQIAALQTDFAAFAEKWGMKLTESLAPDLRDDLRQSFSRVATLYMKQITAAFELGLNQEIK